TPAFLLEPAVRVVEPSLGRADAGSSFGQRQVRAVSALPWSGACTSREPVASWVRRDRARTASAAPGAADRPKSRRAYGAHPGNRVGAPAGARSVDPGRPASR